MYRFKTINRAGLRVLIVLLMLLTIIPISAQCMPVSDHPIAIEKPELSIELDNSSLPTDIEGYSQKRKNYFLIGVEFLEQENFGKAYEQFQQYINLSLKTKDDEIIIDAYFNVGYIYKEHLIFEVAIEYYLLALSKSHQVSSSSPGNIYTEIGGLYYDLGNIDKANTYYLKSLDSYILEGNKEQLATAYNNIGEMYRFKSQYDTALLYYNKSIILNKKFDNQTNLGVNYGNIGEVYLNQDRFELALQSILLSKAIFEKENNAERLASVYCLLGFYHYKMNDYQEAINNFNKTLNFDLDSYAKKEMIIIEAYWGISQSYKKLNRVSKAYSYFQKYVVLKDKLYRSEKYNAILKVQSSFETKEKEKEINLLKKKALKEEQEKNKQKKYSIVIISLLVLVVILLIYLFALRKEDFKKKTLLFEQTDTLNKLLIENKDIENKRLLIENKELEAQEELNKLREEKLRADLEYGQRKLSATAMQVIGKNEMLSNLKKSLENLMNKKTKPDKVISDLVREIDNNIDLDKDWNNFKLHFEEVHQGFFFRLIEKYNDLTVDELKLCAYLKINLSSKEIAQILNITPVAVNKRRNRLRKKVNLDGTEDLFSFLNKV